jgi:DNA-binding HxlR family transcriptional regulator
MARSRGYGQFCPVAKAAEILAERWTLLVLRELLSGSRRFNDLHRGVPLMSATLLSQRLVELERVGLVERRLEPGERGPRYYPTAASEELRPIIEAIGVWGMRFVRTSFAPEDLDPTLLMWDIRRNVRAEHLPPRRVVVRFEFPEQAAKWRVWWLVKEREASELDLCLHDPGFPIDLTVTTSLKTMTRVWLGDEDVAAAIRAGDLRLEGPPALRLGFYDWIGLSVFARVAAS